MKNKLILILAMAISSTLYGQGFEFGLKAGVTGTSGTTKLPETSGVVNNIKTTAMASTANPNGMGYNFLAGLYGKVNLPLGFFVMGEAQYAQFTLPQKAENVEIKFSNSGNISYTSVDVVSQLNGVNVPIFFGKQFFAKVLRVYVGPNFLFVTKAEQKRTFNGGTASPGFSSGLKTETTENLMENTELPVADRKVLSTIIGLEAGVGVTIPIVGIGVDLRYSVPVISGVYQNNDISGFLGITTLSLSYRLFKVGL